MLIAGLLAALFLLPRAVLALVLAALLVAAALEWGGLCRLGRRGAWAFAAAVASVFMLSGTIGLQPALFAGAAAFWIVVAPLWMWRGVRPGQVSWIGASGFAVLVPAALAMVSLEPVEALVVLIFVWVADSAAYMVGRTWGRHKLAPAISPGKSWEGVVGGLVGALAYAIIVGFFIQGVIWTPFLASAALLFVTSIVGDLFESAVKRQAGVKDSGTLLPGHGGVLDRIDSTTATLPLAALLWPILRAGT